MTADLHPQRIPWLDPALIVATCGWLGRIPFAPGTFGSLVGLPLSLATGTAAARLAGMVGLDNPAATPLIELGLIAVFFLASVPVCTRASRLLGSKDPGAVVLDEAVAVPTVLALVPLAGRIPAVLAVAFVLFRGFDILKPPPVHQVESLPAGLGIMADDQVAAVFAAACLAAARWQGWL
ncbi:MAG: phosphatidylglycerophosphatase A [Planctomycetota bacterium]